MDINLANANATNKKISELYRGIKAGDLILQPEFQRKFVWNITHRKEFIDTILRGLPFPEIYIADSGVDVEKVASQEVVVDGQQRLSTIVQYIDGALKIDAKDIIKPYSEIESDAKKRFLNYKVTVRQLEGVDTPTIKEIFRRINLTKYSLNSYEIHHAIYDGEFITLAKELANNEKIKRIPTFIESEDTRMQDFGFILLVLATLQLGGYFTGNDEIEDVIKKYNDDYPDKAKLRQEVLKAAAVINSLSLDPDSTWYKRSNLFTLFVVLSREKAPENLASRLIEFEQKLLKNKSLEKKDKNDFSLYYFYTVAGTNSRLARVTRDRILKKHVLNK